MTRVNGDFDQILRSALHAEVDSIEPDERGLERIRQRTHAPWLVRQMSLMLIECVDLARLIGIRLEPGFAGLRTTIAERGGPWEALVGLLSSTVASVVALFTPPGRRNSPHRSPRGGSSLGWLRPALAVAGAVVIVVAGVYGLVQVRDTISLELFPSGSPASNGPGSTGGGQGPSLNGQSAPTGVVPSGGRSGSARPSPKASCSSSPKAAAAPTDSPTDPTPTDTPTPSPTDPTPTDTPTPSPSDTPSTSAVSLGGPGIHTVAVVAPASCRSASPSQSS
jgi:hypothetical protein